MKAFILAAGHGTRLRPITDYTPKCLVPIGTQPMLSIWLERCEQFGITEVLINVHSHAEIIRDFLNKQHCRVRVSVVEEQQLLGSAGTILANREWVATEQAFWIFYSDVLTNMDFGSMLELHKANPLAATLGLSRVPDPSRCGIAQVNDRGVITAFVEKPKLPVGNLAFSGIMLAGQAFIEHIPRKTPSDIGFDVLPQLVGNMAAFEISDYLLDIGTMENYMSAQSDWPGLKTRRLAVTNA